MNFKCYTTSLHLQIFLEATIEMKLDQLFAPPGQRTCMYFIDDISMHEVDTYGTSSDDVIEPAP
jgi:dynein heavy chain